MKHNGSVCRHRVEKELSIPIVSVTSLRQQSIAWSIQPVRDVDPDAYAVELFKYPRRDRAPVMK